MSLLKRDKKRGIIGGVCQGLENHTATDAWLWRVLFILAGFPLIYFLMWILIDDINNIEVEEECVCKKNPDCSCK